MEHFLINKTLFNGFITRQEPPLKALNLAECKEMGAMTCELQGYCCPRCSGNYGYVFAEKDGAMFFCGDKKCLMLDAMSSQSTKAEAKEIKLQEADASAIFHIGPKYRNASLAKWLATDENKTLVLDWLKSLKNMLVVLGAPGKGKTYFCVAAANYLIGQKQDVKYYNSRRYFEEIQVAIGQSQNQYGAVKRISQADVLILDDIGASTNSEWQKEMLLEIVDLRYSEEKPTIITSNLSIAEMENTLGKRTTRRVAAAENRIITV